ncbi:MAG TPA: hypothetical protein VEQ60_12485 [Longimicrobium sp.]|nr:hypothetical protein [Longimicrobium sp.]
MSTHLVNVDRLRRDLYPIPGDSRDFGGFVYDPTELLRQPGHRHVFVVHGYACGLAAIDPASGQLHHCWIRGRGQQPYGFFSSVVPCGAAPMAWARCRDGDFLWRVGHEPVPAPRSPGPAFALYPGALLCLADDGGELLWCDLPAG